MKLSEFRSRILIDLTFIHCKLEKDAKRSEDRIGPPLLVCHSSTEGLHGGPSHRFDGFVAGPLSNEIQMLTVVSLGPISELCVSII